MRMFNAVVASLVLSIPLAAQANSPEHTSAYRDTVQQYAAKTGRPAPQIVEYRYGVKLDVARVMLKSPLDKSCQAVPRLMIYEDSKGGLNALQYQAMSECRSNN